MSFSLPTVVLPVVVGALLLCVAGAAALTYSFRAARAHIDQRSTELRAMRRVNAEQKIQIEVIAIKSSAMAADIDKIRQLDEQVRQLIGTAAKDDKTVSAVSNTVLPTVQPPKRDDVTPQVDAMLDRRDAPLADRSSFDRSRTVLTEALNTSDRLDHLKTQLAQSLPQLMDAKAKIEDRLDYLAHRPTGWPAWGTVTSWFGWRPSPFGWGGDNHPGIDIAVPIGTAVQATADGTVIFTGYSGDYGRLVVIDHGYGYRSYYGHLSSYAVEVGDKVKRGAVIAYSGNTGLSTGPHVHYEIRLWGTATDPEPYLEAPSLKEG